MSAATQNAPAVGGGTQGFSPIRGIKAAMDRIVKVVSGSPSQKAKAWVAPPEQPNKDSKSWSGARHKFLSKKDQKLSSEAKKELRRSRKKTKRSFEERSEYFKKMREGGRKSLKSTEADTKAALQQKQKDKLATKRPPVLKSAGKGKSGKPVKQPQKNCDVIYEIGTKTSKYDKTNRQNQFQEYRKQAFKKLKETKVPRVASAAHAVHYELIYQVGNNKRYAKRSTCFKKFREENKGANQKDFGVKLIYEVGKAAPKA